MKVGIMGGTLDPIHNGHLVLASTVREKLSLDKVLLLPAGDPPHKSQEIDRQDRWEMVRLASMGHDDLEACALEILRDGTTYTVDTLRELHARYPEAEWYYIIGADTVSVVDEWRSFDEVAKLTRFVAVGRPGYDRSRMDADIDRLHAAYGADFMTMEDIVGPDISSSEIRERVSRGEPIDRLVPEAVESYIREKGLYLSRFTWNVVLEKLRERLNEKRFIHTLGVAETAMELARIHGADVQRARLAGLLHDCAKYMERGEMLRYVRENVPDTDEEELSMKSVVHAPAGMLVARDVFGVRDTEILSSIRKHTLGDAKMCDLDLIIYIADFIEPNRADFEGMAEARALARRDLKACARYCAELSGAYVIAKGYEISSRTKRMIENL